MVARWRVTGMFKPHLRSSNFERPPERAFCARGGRNSISILRRAKHQPQTPFRDDCNLLGANKIVTIVPPQVKKMANHEAIWTPREVGFAFLALSLSHLQSETAIGLGSRKAPPFRQKRERMGQPPLFQTAERAYLRSRLHGWPILCAFCKGWAFPILNLWGFDFDFPAPSMLSPLTVKACPKA